MGIYWRGQVGVGHSQTRVQNRILLQPTFRGRRKADTHTHGPRQTLSPRRGNSGPAGQAGNYKSSGRDGTTLPVLLFSDQKTGRHLASHSKPKTPEHKTHQTKTLPYGDLKLNITPTQKGHVGGDRRLTGRLPAHLDTQRTPTIPSVPVRRTRLPVPGAPIRPSHGSQNLHESRGSSSRLPQKKRGHPLRISRRLVGSREQSIGSNQQRPQNAPDPSRTGLDREPEEITAITLPDDPVPRGHTGLHHRGSPTLRRKSRGSQGDHTTDLGTPGVTNGDMAPGPGTHGQPRRYSETVQATHATSATAPAEVRRPYRPRQNNAHLQVRGGHTTLSMVARPKQLEFRGTLCDTATNDIDNDGRVTVRMGSSLEQSHSMGDVVPNRNISPHQHPGDDGGQKSPGSFQRPRTGNDNHNLHRQHDSGGLHQSAGGHPLRETVPTRVGGDNSGRGLRHDPKGFPHRRQAQRDGGRPIQGAYRPQRMVSGTGDLRQNLFDLRQAHDRPVRNTQEQQTPDLLFQTIPPPGLPHGRNVPLLGPHGCVHLPAACMIGQVLRKIRNSKGRFTLIAPFWPRRPWFAEIPQLLMDVPVSLPDKPHLLSQRQGTLSHPDIKGLQLVAWRLSGLPYDREAFQKQLPRWQPTLEGERPQRLTIPVCGSSTNGADRDRYCCLLPL
ncbi:putative receptor tyrosine-protein kinase erbB-4-like [Apostichopus japonicus]|uniref:Putative receptor tyrosine-protein kinase erbB-4-like n=1 Tax=Stichopus japonicus TaxID=307972 RepID=A0A2G8JRK8_STIJA|nr:putative receptor tyrosine-protein kinase erbB-4-like [Apostichopus japonicus]